MTVGFRCPAQSGVNGTGWQQATREIRQGFANGPRARRAAPVDVQTSTRGVGCAVAFNLAQSHSRFLFLEFFGGESHRAELEGIGREVGVFDRLHFTGKMPDPMPVITLADACVLCSETEGLSNVVIEYLLAGKTVVCTSVGGNPELVLEGQTGRLVPVGDVARLASALTDVLSDPPRARQWGEAARQRALELSIPQR